MILLNNLDLFIRPDTVNHETLPFGDCSYCTNFNEKKIDWTKNKKNIIKTKISGRCMSLSEENHKLESVHVYPYLGDDLSSVLSR